MKKYIVHHFPRELKTYASLILASILTVIAITFFLQISEFSQHTFRVLIAQQPILSFIITPITFVSIIYFAKYYCHFIQGSGIPQLIAATDFRNKPIRERLLSFRVATGKISTIFLAMLGGAPIGIEGPSIHIGGSIFYGFNRFIKLNRKLLIHALIAIGGSAGLVVAFNAPIAGMLFVYEEIGRKLKKQAFILIAIVSFFIYLLAVSMRGNAPYLTDLSSYSFDLTLVWQLFPLAIIAGVLGGLFSKLSLYLMGKLIANSKVKVLLIALCLGIIVAFFNYLSKGKIAGSGHAEVLQILNNGSIGLDFVITKYFAVLTSFISTIPGGVFMPSISIGAGLGAEVAGLMTSVGSKISVQVVIIMTMIGYLSAVIRAPLTSTFVILEMTLSLHLLIPGLMVAFIANFISKQIYHQPIYEALAENFSKKV
ncbi:Chloride channel protein [Bathymodiolus heckerae thiotrophic gill symbiont]|uniref:chloride channel protein n=1 Tax=Bathymodiolus heckerae thiotrophic gill symbiont TaxID=1052212 RepID=UPI0010AFFA1C|nr:chloride channel protein [Bathymodiolus heckerae thiotrophic gill symbiont]SMN13343.1 Chloride channel protein [Bathymodiolus heckerae thiotrophic gill symbiont]SMN15673.1 Chloride channel protein [uncultured Candidatus Thioglobus sp.]